MQKNKFVIKRDGIKENFDISKIEVAIKAVVNNMDARILAGIVAERAYNDGETSVKIEWIQNCIEKELVMHNYIKEAHKFVCYREKRKNIRLIKQLTKQDLVGEYLERNQWEEKSNANESFCLQGLNSHIFTNITKKYWLETIYTQEVRDLHNKGYIHIHDLSTLSTYCQGLDLKDLLVSGIPSINGHVGAAPAKHFRAVLGQIVNFLFLIQAETAGAVALSNFDTLLAPYIANDYLRYEDVLQEIQSFVFQMNVPSRVGGQTPFSNISLDIEVPTGMLEQPVIIGGKLDNKKVYGDFQRAVDMINKAFCQVMLKGDVSGRPFTFPIPTYAIQDNFDWDNKRNDPIFELAGKFGQPYFSNFMGSNIDPEDQKSMCPFIGSQKVFARINGKTSHITLLNLSKRNISSKIEVPIKGKWVKAKPVEVDHNGIFYEITLKNGIKYTTTDNHLNVTLRGDVRSDKLEIGDKFEYSFKKLDYDGLGSFELGQFLGLYMAEGSQLGKTGIQFSLDGKRNDLIELIVGFLNKNFASHCSICDNTGFSKSVFSTNKYLRNFVDRFIKEKYREKKFINYNKFSSEMIRGIWDGWMLGNGKYDGTEGYTYSYELSQQLLFFAFVIGKPVIFRKYFRTSVLGGKEYSNYIYTIHICDIEKGRIYKKINNKYYSAIAKIEIVEKKKQKAFCVAVKGKPYFQLDTGLVTHNCRLKIDKTKLQFKGGGLFGAGALTGSIGVVTLNLAKINSDYSEYTIEEVLKIAVNSLEIKRKKIEELTGSGLYPYTKFYLRNIKKKTGKFWSNHFSTIGVIGGHEACYHEGFKGIESKRGKKWMCSYLDRINDYLEKLQKNSDTMYNLEATPAESTAYSIAQKDGLGYSYYTNSTNLPADSQVNLKDAMIHQEPLLQKYTGGSVFHIYIGNSISGDLAKASIKTACENFKIPYFSIAPTFSICPIHGIIHGEQANCGICGTKTEIFKKITGYIRPVESFNPGKKLEHSERVLYKIGKENN